MFEFLEVESALKKVERPSKPAKIVRKSENNVKAPSTGACTTSRVGCDMLKVRCKAFLVETQCISGMVEEAMKLRVQFAGIENQPLQQQKKTSEKWRDKQLAHVAEKRVIATERSWRKLKMGRSKVWARRNNPIKRLPILRPNLQSCF